MTAAARIVVLRWEDFLRSDVRSRGFVFASYLAELDTEEAAAAQMSGYARAPLNAA